MWVIFEFFKHPGFFFVFACKHHIPSSVNRFLEFCDTWFCHLEHVYS